MRAFAPRVADNGEKVLHGLPAEVRFCTRCVMSNQRPSSSPELHKKTTHIETVGFYQDGVCHPCVYAERKKNIDWHTREEQLLALLDKHRSKSGHIDVIVPGSGGKDSAYVSHILKDKYGMHPLTVTWAPHMYTDIGWANFNRWIHVGGLDNMLVTPNPHVHRRLTRLAFLNLLNPFQPFIIGQKNIGPRLAAQYGVPLVMYGEHQAEYHNSIDETDSPLMPRRHYTMRPEQQLFFGGLSIDDLQHDHSIGGKGIREGDLQLYMPCTEKVAEANDLEVHYFSYYKEWIPQQNYYYAVEHCGFLPNQDGRSEGTYSKYASLDDRIDGFHYYTMFIKFGQGRAMNDAAHEIRDNHITRGEAVALVNKYDGEFPKKYFQEFLDYIDISEKVFWETIDRNRSPHLWERQHGAAKQDGEEQRKAGKGDVMKSDGWVLKHRVA